MAKREIFGHHVSMKAKSWDLLGKPYRFGAESHGYEPPDAFDCSEFVQYVLRLLGMEWVDGSYNQYADCEKNGTIITIDEARGLPGALVFRRSETTKAICHVAFCDGLNNTIEARGKDYGTGVWPWRPGWTDAAKIPGVKYF